MDADGWLADTRTSYNTVADSYARLVPPALAASPYLRSALGIFAEMVHSAGGGLVADIGCGPGHVAAHLHDLGVSTVGIDLSPAMIEVARRDHPDLRFEVGSMTDLDLADASIAGMVAFWSLIHVPDEEIPAVFDHFRRVLRPGAPLLVGFHVGDTTSSKTAGYGGHPMKVQVHRRPVAQVDDWLRAAGFAIEAEIHTDPDGTNPGAMIFARSGHSDGEPPRARRAP